MVIGGIGVIGAKTAAILRLGGQQFVGASRPRGTNTITTEGLREAMADVQVVIDVARSPSFED